MVRAAPYAYLVLAWAFLVGLVVQVALAGLGLFDDPDNLAAHTTLGWILHLSPLLILVAAALSRAGRAHWAWALALAAVVFVVPILAAIRDASPTLAGLHPVAALAAFWIATVVAWNSLRALRDREAVGQVRTV